jgi:histone acetyltransferase (RNA polymerase elongator complex component)
MPPDRESIRNFVSLDTRSREIRNKYGDWRQKKMKHDEGKDFTLSSQVQNHGIVIRKYLSSVGTEYFVSLEDEFGYLYGFVRLLLPKA